MSRQILRIIDGKPVWLDPAAVRETAGLKPQGAVVTDDLGCIAQQVEELRADAKLNGFSAIEFKPDPTVMQDGQPTFYRLHCNSPEQLARYAEHRGVPDNNSKHGSGAMLTAEHFNEAQRKMREKYPVRRN